MSHARGRTQDSACRRIPPDRAPDVGRSQRFAGGRVPFTGRAFRRRRTTVDPIQPQKASSLVIDNVFRYTRNPMYLGLVLVLGAWAVYLSNLASLVMLPVFIAYLTRFQIQPEERVLLEKFGDDFEQYMRKVRRWI